jgi:fatty acid desaturase
MAAPATPGRIEWPTVGLAVVIYSVWLAATWASASLPTPILACIGGWIIAWQSSLQHEAIHGHPTPWRRVNHLLAAWPLSLWLPFGRYRNAHLTHHATENLTDPQHDPESRYVAAGAGLGHRVARILAAAQASLRGRLVLGPPIEIVRFLAGDLRALARGDRAVSAAWALHLIALLPVLAWLHLVCHLSLGRYLLCFVYPGTALSLLRSYAEHRADAVADRRVAVVERAPVLGLLFLNNNLHAAHHAWPAAPWYLLRPLYRQHRARLLEANGGLVYDGYAEIARRFLLHPHDRIDHLSALSPPVEYRQT